VFSLTKLVVEILLVDEHPLPVSVAALGLGRRRSAYFWQTRLVVEVRCSARPHISSVGDSRQRNLPLIAAIEGLFGLNQTRSGQLHPAAGSGLSLICSVRKSEFVFKKIALSSAYHFKTSD